MDKRKRKKKDFEQCNNMLICIIYMTENVQIHLCLSIHSVFLLLFTAISCRHQHVPPGSFWSGNSHWENWQLKCHQFAVYATKKKYQKEKKEIIYLS